MKNENKIIADMYRNGFNTIYTKPTSDNQPLVFKKHPVQLWKKIFRFLMR